MTGIRSGCSPVGQGPVTCRVCPGYLASELNFRASTWCQSIRLSKMFPREDGFSGIVCNIHVFFKMEKSGLQLLVKCQFIITKMKESGVGSRPLPSEL